jgi:hypothetical protein
VRPPRLQGLAGAAIAVGVFAAVIALPRTIEEGHRPLAPSERAPLACVASTCDPAASPFVGRVDAELASRMPALEERDRLKVARTIVLEAAAARIDPLLVLALIHVESSYDPRALSGAGARGLMQLREPTLRRELERAGLPHVDPFDPATNVVAGVRYLRRLLDAFGREEVALMAYNAGPNRILGYLRDGEIPERFHAYPRRVQAVHRHLRRNIGASEPRALAVARRPVAPE